MYGCELFPFKVPKYVPMRLFALEYFRQIINADLVHFYAAKKKAHLRIKNHSYAPVNYDNLVKVLAGLEGISF
jgi:hypothetical protein